MNGLEIAVTAIVCVLGGIGLALLGVFCVFMIKTMNKLQQAAEEVSRVARETLKEAQSVVSNAEKLVGEGSPIARAAKAVGNLSNTMPEVMGGLKVFNETFSKIYKSAFVPDDGRKSVIPVSAPGDDSEFIPYSETAAADFERTASVQKERIVLSDDELAMMRTDQEPVAESPTPES